MSSHRCDDVGWSAWMRTSPDGVRPGDLVELDDLPYTKDATAPTTTEAAAGEIRRGRGLAMYYTFFDPVNGLPSSTRQSLSPLLQSPILVMGLPSFGLVMIALLTISLTRSPRGTASPTSEAGARAGERRASEHEPSDI
jgi:hypothetical protein